MTKLLWDQVGQKTYETGVDHGVLYLPNASGVYDTAEVWNGLVSVSESPSGAEASPQYADNIKYLNLVSAEEFGASLEAFTYPDKFAVCDGTAELSPGITIGQQNRKAFGLSYRTLVGNDLLGTDFGYKIHLVYNALAAPTEKAYNTVNESPEAITFSWELTTTPTAVGTIDGVNYKPTATLTIDSTKVDAVKLAAFEDILYGTANTDGALPTPAEVYAHFGTTQVGVKPTQPTFAGNTITIPATTGVEYLINGVVKTGAVPITKDTIVVAKPKTGYKWDGVVDNDWLYKYV